MHRTPGIWVLIGWLQFGALWAQSTKLDEEQLKEPVIRIGALDELIGTGFLVGREREKLYYVTAAHVVDSFDFEEDIPLQFWNKGEKLDHQGSLLERDKDLDLAVIVCARPSEYVIPPSFPASTYHPRTADKIKTLGQPYGFKWDISFRNVIKETTVSGDSRFFWISSTDIDRGCSGGPVLGKQNQLLGMMQNVGYTRSTVLSQQTLIDQLAHWRIPKNLLGERRANVVFLEKFDSTDSILIREFSDLPYAINLNQYDRSIPSYELRLVQGGAFKMGSKRGEAHESPPHMVKLDDYMMGETEVTQELWEAVMGYNYSAFQGNDQLPVESVSWEECQQFIYKLRAMTHLDISLPTEAEWEFAARSRSYDGPVYAGTDKEKEIRRYANFCDEDCPMQPREKILRDGFQHTAPVKSFRPNEQGLFDMSGNVYEWCQDWYDGSYYEKKLKNNPAGPQRGSSRVIRGGGWSDLLPQLRTTHRSSFTPSNHATYIGLRLCIHN